MAIGSITIRSNHVTRYGTYLRSAVPKNKAGQGADLVFTDYSPQDDAEGGLGGFTAMLEGRETLLKELFEYGLGRHVESWGYALAQDQEGYIHEMRLFVPPNSYTITLENMANRMFMRSDHDGDGSTERSTVIENEDSQDRFGTKDHVLKGGEVSTLSVADQSVQQYIDWRAFPKPEMSAGGASGQVERLEIVVRPYPIRWRVYNQTDNTGNVRMTALFETIVGERSGVRVISPESWDSTFDAEEGRPTDADALSPDWDHTVLDALADADSETDADGDLNEDDGTETPFTESGGIIYSSDQARFGEAIQLAEATTNLVDNPSFETNTTGWTAPGSNTVALSTEQAKFGSKSGKLVFQGATSPMIFRSITLTAAAHTYGIWLYVPSSWSGTSMFIDFHAFTGAMGDNDVAVDLDVRDEWQFVVAPNMTPDAGDLSGFIRVSGTGQNNGEFFYIDGVQVEAKAYPTPYCDGSLGTGHTWSGTAHASTSSRTATDLQYSVDLPSQFTISKTIAPLTLPSEISADGWYWQWRVDANNLIGLRADASSDAVVFEWIGAGSSDTIADVDLTRLQQYEYTVTYDGTTVTLYRDGSSVGTISSPTAHGNIPDTLHLGGVSGASHANGWLDEFVVDARAWSSGEVSSHNARSSAFSDEALLYMDFDSTADGENFIAKLGSNGLKVDFDDTNAAYITLNATSVDRTEGAIDVYFNPRNLLVPAGEFVYLVGAVDGGGNIRWAIRVTKDGNGNYELQSIYDTDGGTETTVGNITLDSSGYVLARLAFRRSSGAGNDDGFQYLYVYDGGAVKSASATGIDNDTRDWDDIDAGMVFSNATTQGGSFAFDEIRVSESVSPVWITEAAARDGSYGWAFTLEDTTARYVEDTSPTTHGQYTRELWVDPSGLTMATNDDFVICALRDDTAAVDVARIHMTYDGTDKLVYPSIRTDGGSYVDGDSFKLNEHYANRLRLAWLAQDDDGGRAYLFHNDHMRSKITDVDNDTLRVDRVREGAVSGLDAGTSGVLKLDTMRGAAEVVIDVTDETGVAEFIRATNLENNKTAVTREYDTDSFWGDIIRGTVRLGDDRNIRWIYGLEGRSIVEPQGRKFYLKQAAPVKPEGS